VEADFSPAVQPYIFDIIIALGKTIPALAANPDRPEEDKRRVRAWLVIHTILNQSNHAATTQSLATNPMTIEVLADSFLDFVNGVQSFARGLDLGLGLG